MDYKNFTDNLIEKFFETNKQDDPHFYDKLEKIIRSSQTYLNAELNKLALECEKNSELENKQKDEYKDKLQEISLIYSNFEGKVENLNNHYHNKLAYISTLSNYLGEFEKFKINIVFANKIFEKLNELNSSENIDINDFEIFTDSNKLIEEGIEVFHALRHIVDSCAADFPIFARNFKSMDLKIKESIFNSIRDFYENNELQKLETLFKVTDLISPDMIIDMYVKLIVEQMNLGFSIKSLRSISLENISNEMFNQIFRIIEEFHNSIIRTAEDQFGNKKSKIFLIFPETRHKDVISCMVKEIQQILKDFRDVFNSYDKNPNINEAVINLIEHIYPDSIEFVNKFKQTLEFIESDLWNEIKNDTNIFLQILHSTFQARQFTLNRTFIYENSTLKINAIKNNIKEYNSRTLSLDLLQEKFFDVIYKDELSLYLKFCNISIERYNKFLGSVQEKEDGIEELNNQMVDSITNKIKIYCEAIVFIINEKDKNKININNLHFHVFYTIGHLVAEFQSIFTFELKHVFNKTCKKFPTIEQGIKNIVASIKSDNLKPLFDRIWSSTDNYAKLIYKDFKHKDAYNSSSNKIENMKIGVIERLTIFLKPIFTVVCIIFYYSYRIYIMIQYKKI